MPLTWDVSKIENYKKNFPSVTRVDEPFPVHDKDGNVVEYLGERKEYEAWNPITNVLVMTNMLLGMPKLTADNVDEMYRRLCMYEQASGGAVLMSKGEPRSITYDELLGHVGLSVNVSPKTNRQFDMDIARILREEAGRQLLKAQSKEDS